MFEGKIRRSKSKKSVKNLLTWLRHEVMRLQGELCNGEREESFIHLLDKLFLSVCYVLGTNVGNQGMANILILSSRLSVMNIDRK